MVFWSLFPAIVLNHGLHHLHQEGAINELSYGVNDLTQILIEVGSEGEGSARSKFSLVAIFENVQQGGLEGFA